MRSAKVYITVFAAVFLSHCVSIKEKPAEMYLVNLDTSGMSCVYDPSSAEYRSTSNLDCLKDSFAFSIAAKKTSVIALYGENSPRTQTVLTSLELKKSSYEEKNRQMYKETVAREERERKEREIAEANARADAERLELAKSVEAKLKDYEDLKNAGPDNTSCQNAKKKLSDARRAAQFAQQAASFIPGAGALGDLASKADSGLSKLELAANIYCIFDAAAAGKAQSALAESLGMLTNLMAKNPNPRTAAAEQDIVNKARSLMGK